MHSMAADSKLQSVLKQPASVRPWPEVMCFHVDPCSGMMLYVVKELKDAGHLKFNSAQKAFIIGVEGTKGNQLFGCTASANTAAAAFSKTATHVFRMVMLKACGVNPAHWPTGGKSSSRNKDKLKYEQILGDKYILANSYEEAREYWCAFDQMYPHYIIEKCLKEKTGALNNIMIIFKNYMQDMIEISMNIRASQKTGNTIDCCVSATVIHRSIDLEGADGEWLDRMALAVRGVKQPLHQHFEMLLDLESKDPPTKLADHLSALYDSLPATGTKKGNPTENRVCENNKPELAKRPNKTASRTNDKQTEEITTSTTKVENIRTTHPVTKEVLETKRIVTERTVSSTKNLAAHKSHSKDKV